jgi:hypothetical protein
MPEAREYRAYAATCVRLAQTTEDRHSKVVLLDMARAWLALAGQHSMTRTTKPPPWPSQQAARQQSQP